ncbi:pyridoxal phosphate-dependent decarboxylase family protein [Aquabacter spiritensis]|uniref:Glutamate/tyrosine decarboxylase-like PLP-dependent enzyme n=1 Tax=Aquabacter spiritensis TaxID=933073 RepID=A0A4R3LXZ1_9HYPH|nr:pyridoxal-dependent decarboxylase [Aquabacter spiritensis]TCT05544.1 glutamate/tyrosine decarboxylase-like PLP-dependent enzyme [Aquabacter spiritensis]
MTQDAFDAALDPADWAAMRAIFHAAADDGLAHLAQARARPVWTRPPDAARAALAEPVPQAGQPVAAIYDTFKTHILPYGTGNVHPAFFGWALGAGTAEGVLGEMLAAFMNCNLGGWDQIAADLERQVIDWCRQMTGFPAGSSGLLTSGTSLGTLIALAVAREAATAGEIGEYGVAAAGSGLVGYASTEAHGCFAKAFATLGLGRAHLRRVPVDADHRLDCAALEAMIAADRARGLRPFCAIATCGTINTGAIDDLARVADICARARLWFHVDAAFGVGALLTAAHRARAAPLARADSIAFDFHKWFQVPYDAGIVLIRDAAAHRAAFAAPADYLAPAARGLAAGAPWFCDYGPELSRSFRALKIWFTFKAHGLSGLSAMIEKNCRQAQFLADLIAANAPRLALLAPVNLNIVCFRYVPADGSDADALNAEIVADLQEQGIAAPSLTTLSGRTAIRVCLVNHRTRAADLERLVEATLALGAAREAAARA